MKKLFTFLAVIFFAINVNAQNIYGDMESWKTYSAGFPPTSLEAVKGWHCIDSFIFSFGPFLVPGGKFSKQLFKTTDAHSGSYAAKIMTAQQDSFGLISGVITNATINVDISTQGFSMSGGTPVSGRIKYVNAWIKYKPQGDDSASMVASAILTGAAADGSDSVLGTAYQSFAATPGYSLASLQLTYDDPNAMPDAIQVIFTSSGQQPADSSTLYVDDVSYTLFPVGVQTASADNMFKAYPNPAANTIFISGPAGLAATWQATNISGQVVATEKFTAAKSIDVSNYAPGLYFYTIMDNAGNVIQRNKFSIAH